jgi:hypothetical protein
MWAIGERLSRWQTVTLQGCNLWTIGFLEKGSRSRKYWEATDLLTGWPFDDGIRGNEMVDSESVDKEASLQLERVYKYKSGWCDGWRPTEIAFSNRAATRDTVGTAHSAYEAQSRETFFYGIFDNTTLSEG